MLCLMTLADVEAVSGRDPHAVARRAAVAPLRRRLQPAHARLRRRGDRAAARPRSRRWSRSARPISTEGELSRFLEGFPQRYLALFDAETIYRHARLARNIQPDEVHCFLERKGDVWELTVATLDRPYLFSNLCGVLSYFGMDILRGSAMTEPVGAGARHLPVHRRRGLPAHQRRRRRAVRDASCATWWRGARTWRSLLARRESGLLHPPPPRRVEPLVRFDQAHSQRYTVLEIVAQDAPGLLHRISLVISRHGCDVDLVLISTEGDQRDRRLPSDQRGGQAVRGRPTALKEDVEAMLEGRRP